MFGFQKLEIYNLSKEIVKVNYQLVKKFPSDEKFALVQQMNRAAVSIPSNIAEGTSRKGNKDKAHFINIAYGSLMELVCQMEISLELGYIEQKEYDNFVCKSKNLAVKMSNYIRTINDG
ncbi:MAG: four helix bundle protein [Bacillota bacterium]